jgi:hypothetical protein
MYAERLMLETDMLGKLKHMPALPANKKVEAIFLVIAETDQAKPRRQPHPDIAGKAKIIGNIIDTVPVADWDLPK